MVNCPICGRHVDYKDLRSDHPKCDEGHDLGTWVHCENLPERHVYLRKGDSPCPYCSSNDFQAMNEGTRVKCLHVTDTGKMCEARAYEWMIEGPPCFMNHVDKMKIV
jgi:hypothetical protein